MATNKMKIMVRKYNLKSLLETISKEKNKTRLNALLPDVEAAMEPLVEAAVRDNFDKELKRAAKRALSDDEETPDLQGELFAKEQS